MPSLSTCMDYLRGKICVIAAHFSFLSTGFRYNVKWLHNLKLRCFYRIFRSSNLKINFSLKIENGEISVKV